MATGGQRALLEDALAAQRSGGPFAVLDERWPSAVRLRAEAVVGDAVAHGRVRPGDLVVFSSGSTDRPRGIVRSWASWQASVHPLSELIATPVGAVGIPGRLSSSLSFHGAWHARVSGREVVLADEWTADRVVDVTVVHCVPAQALRFTWPPGLRTLVVAGDHTPSALRERCVERGVRLVEYYGSSEASFVLARVGAGPLRPFAGVQVRLDRAACLWSRSEFGFREYLSGDGPAVWDAEGFLSVGDLAEPDGAGYRLLGRPGTIATGAHSVQVAEVEATLRGISAVRGVVVAAVPHDLLGEVVAAVVEAEDEKAVRAAARQLPAPARPRRWVFVQALPRTATGKPDRSAAHRLFDQTYADKGGPSTRERH